jgi:RNA polymerase sigma factor (TIGR02999 family)
VRDPSLGWENRAHFFAAAAEAMRRILVERARRVAARKRGAGLASTDLGEVATPVAVSPEELLALHAALERLERNDAELARIVSLRYFAGLTVEETARALGISPRSANRQWTAARAFLLREIGRSGG